jgi:hypothetical protein
VDELLLLIWCERDHSELPVGMDRRKDPGIDAEVGMAHVRAFDRASHSECHAAEVIVADSCQSRRSIFCGPPVAAHPDSASFRCQLTACADTRTGPCQPRPFFSRVGLRSSAIGTEVWSILRHRSVVYTDDVNCELECSPSPGGAECAISPDR